MKRKGKSFKFFIAKYLKTHGIEIRVKRGFGVLVLTSLRAVHKVLGEELLAQIWYFHDASLTLKSQEYSREYSTIEIQEMTMWAFYKTTNVTPKV